MEIQYLFNNTCILKCIKGKSYQVYSYDNPTKIVRTGKIVIPVINSIINTGGKEYRVSQIDVIKDIVVIQLTI